MREEEVAGTEMERLSLRSTEAKIDLLEAIFVILFATVSCQICINLRVGECKERGRE